MIHKTISLVKGKDVTLTTYIHDQSAQGNFQIPQRPAIIVMPGGAYSFLSDAEGEPVALTFLKEGYNTFVLRYSVGDAAPIRKFWKRFLLLSGRFVLMQRSGTSIRML